MNKIQKQALENVLNYLSDEESNYKNAEEDEKKNHIWKDCEILHRMKEYYEAVEPTDGAKETLRKAGYLMDGLWHIDDIFSYAEDNGYEKPGHDTAEEMLESIGGNFDATIGVSWHSFEAAFDDYEIKKKGEDNYDAGNK